MKTINIISIATAVLLAGCAKNEKTPDNGQGNGKGMLTVTVKSEDPKGRAVVDGTTVTNDLVAAFEGNVAGFTAYVFNWTTGDLEASATAVGGTATITGLNTAGTKRVLVIANGEDLVNSSIPQFANNPNYSRLAEGYVALADQSFTSFGDLTKGFLMTGENPSAIQLTAGDNNAVSIPIRRVAAKIQLGDISFDSAVSLSDLARFNLTGASIQRAVNASGLGTGDIAAIGSPSWIGGETGSVSLTANAALGNAALNLASFLEDLINGLNIAGLEPIQPGGLGAAAENLNGTLGAAVTAAGGSVNQTYKVPAFWYVLPNQSETIPTLLTLKGSYAGEDYYYPIEINTPASNPTANNGTDGKGLYVKRNTIYKVNVKFHSFVGTKDPDTPGKQAAITVTVEPQDWEGPVIQNTTW